VHPFRVGERVGVPDLGATGLVDANRPGHFTLAQHVGTNGNLTSDQRKQSVYLVEAGGTITRVGVWSDGHPSVTDYCEFPA
jgi:hypothetical protein